VSVSNSQHLWATAPVATANPYHLDAGEFDIVRLVGRGVALAEIADTLGLTGRAVSLSRERLMQKLGARNLAHFEHIASTLWQADGVESEPVYLEDYADDADEPDLVFAD
jgi:DNA-binding NarL/FixJ family response regulator